MNDFNAIVCEAGCGSPCWAFTKSVWIFETNRLELRVICGGCGTIQSKQYSEDLINGSVELPIFTGDSWIYPEDIDYQEAVHYSEHEKLIEIVGLPRTEKHQIPPRRYS